MIIEYGGDTVEDPFIINDIPTIQPEQLMDIQMTMMRNVMPER